MNVWQRLCWGVVIASLAAVLATSTLPYVRYPQTATFVGPAVPYGSSPYSISGYYIPTVPQGNKIVVSLSGYNPGSVDLTLFPSAGSNLVPAGPPVLTIIMPRGSNASGSVVSNSTQPFGIYVNSYNGTSFTLVVRSTWSPFYDLRIYTVPAAFFLLAGVVGVYYYRATEARRRSEEQVMKELRGSRALPKVNQGRSANRVTLRV